MIESSAVMSKPRRLQDIRESHHKLTQEQLAALTEGIVTLPTISRIERRLVSPNLATRKIIADALGVTMADIDWPTDEEVKRNKQAKGGAS